MAWWVSLYLTVLSMMAIGSCIEERKMGFGWLHVFFSLFSALVVVVGVIGYFNEAVVSVFGKLLLPIVIASLVWGVYGGSKDLRQMMPFEDMTASENKVIKIVAISFSILLLLPGYLTGVITGLRAW
ncbi:MAG: hypothetical protein RPU35_17230 [Candidatus Sedimenticola sp. (ex Thyasira tokunagai)]